MKIQILLSRIFEGMIVMSCNGWQLATCVNTGRSTIRVELVCSVAIYISRLGITVARESDHLKGSMPPSIGHMELLVWMQRADFSEHIQGCKSPGDP